MGFLGMLLSINERISARLAEFSDLLLPLAARLVFASALLMFFWRSAATKLDGIFSPSIGAFAQIFPKKFEAVGYDPSAMSGLEHLIVILGTYGEFILPALIVLGLLTRLAALGMIGFIFVMSIVDLTGHAVAPGVLFDGDPYGLIADTRLFWLLLLLILLLMGGGRLSLDGLLKRLIR